MGIKRLFIFLFGGSSRGSWLAKALRAFELKRSFWTELEEGKKTKLSLKQKEELQDKIERLTMSYNEESIYHTQPDLMKLFISSDLPECPGFPEREVQSR